MAAALEVQALGKRFGARWALRGISFALQPGDACALLGPNGAGKTTLLRCCATLAAPTEGRLLVGGFDAEEDGPSARARLGFVSDAPRPYEDLTLEENLRFTARFFDGALPRVPLLLERLGLASRAGEPARALSRGMAQRLALARALLGKPQVLLLDEPFAPLDPASLRLALDALAQAREEGAVILFSTQRLDVVPLGTRRAVALGEGRVAWDAEGSPETLRARYLDAVGGKA